MTVCVVGAGPAGLVVAQLLQRAGVPCVVLERQERDGLRARMKAGMIEDRTVELLRPHGLAEPILERGTRVGRLEFRADGESFLVDYASLCGGRGNYIYPQQELVGDWAEAFLAAGGEIRFGVRATGVEQDDGGAVVTAAESDGTEQTIECDVVACCDGAASAFTANLDELAVAYPFRWLTLIAAAPQSTDGTVYGLHRRGYAGQMHRSPTMTRFMLELPPGDGLDDWPDDRVWPELEERLGAAGRPPIGRGEVVERDILDHRVRVFEPMQDGCVYFAGDAAHLITPAGGKGMNIAIQDAVELAAGLVASDGARLARYSETRLPHVWRHQEFSNLMLSIFNAGDGFAYGLRRARLDQILNDPQYARWFARSYAGVDDRRV